MCLASIGRVIRHCFLQEACSRSLQGQENNSKADLAWDSEISPFSSLYRRFTLINKQEISKMAAGKGSKVFLLEMFMSILFRGKKQRSWNTEVCWLSAFDWKEKGIAAFVESEKNVSFHWTKRNLDNDGCFLPEFSSALHNHCGSCDNTLAWNLLDAFSMNNMFVQNILKRRFREYSFKGELPNMLIEFPAM